MLDDAAWLKQFLDALVAVPTSASPSLPLMQETSPADSTQPEPAFRIAPVLSAPALAKLSITADLLRRLGVHDADAWAPLLAGSCAAHGTTSPRCVAAFLANIMVETGRLSTLVENLNYTPQALLKQWPKRFSAATAQALGRSPGHSADQRGIAEAAYGGRLGNGPPGSGDGWLYRGRGLIQLTGKTNYQKFASRIGMPLEKLPAYLETRPGAADSAAAYWMRAGCNGPAEAGDIEQVRLLVNGGTIGLAEVRENYRAACKLLGVAP
jgi:putative chitinase